MGPYGTLWRHRFDHILKILKFRGYHRIPHNKIILIAKSLLFITFYWQVVNILPFWDPQKTLWRHKLDQNLEIWKLWLHHRIPHGEIILIAKFHLFIPFYWWIINIWPFLGYLGSLGDTVTSQMGPKFKIWKFWLHHRIPHDEISLIAKFHIFIPFYWRVINIWPFWGYLGSLGEPVTSQMGQNGKTKIVNIFFLFPYGLSIPKMYNTTFY